MEPLKNTVDDEEIERFSRIADEWWDPHGKFAPLHKMNPLRMEYLRTQAESHFKGTIKDKTLLDIGCGGGLISEPMARMGFQVTAIDASEKNIGVAATHAKQTGLSIDYRCSAAEAVQATGSQFDVVLALEIIEHVADIPAFVHACCALVKPGGLIVFSTLNRTLKSYALAIVGAEYVLRWLPRGTHSWEKFVKPSELCRHLRAEDMEITNLSGMVMNPLTFKWELSECDLSVNYLLTAVKA